MEAIQGRENYKNNKNKKVKICIRMKVIGM